MKRLLIPFFSLLVGLLLVTAATAQNKSAQLRAMHAVPDSSKITVLIDGKAMFNELTYRDVTAYQTIKPGRYTVMVVSSADLEMVLYETEIEIETGQDYSLISAGKLVLLESFLINDNNLLPATENPQVRFIHLSPNAPTIDLLVKNGIEATLFSEVSFKNMTSFIPLEAHNYEMTLRVAGTSVIALKQVEVTLDKGKSYTLFGVGLAGGEPVLEIIPHVEAELDMPRQPIATVEPSPTLKPTDTPAPTDTPTTESIAGNTALDKQIDQANKLAEVTESIDAPDASEDEDEAKQPIVIPEQPNDTSETESAMPAEETTVEQKVETIASPLVQEASLTEASSQAMSVADTSGWAILVLPPNLAPDTMPVTGIRDTSFAPEPSVNLTSEQTGQASMSQPQAINPVDETALNAEAAAIIEAQENSRLPLLFSLIVIGAGIALGVRSVKEGRQTRPRRATKPQANHREPRINT
ncbi:DUF4397 domain-containing protein [Anaerolineales bacterium HSG25]|nr:DUF4397 domain-containing protein [Anaerolineales bacterium HSG25]